MKHTTFENELRDIRRRALKELKEAIAAHNGRYDYTQYEFAPTMRGEKVCEARLYDGQVFVDTTDSYIAVNESRLTIEEIISLTEYIEPTDEVKDVSGAYPVPVTWVDRDDIESADFDASGITQDDLVKISEQMQNSYLYSGQFIEDVQYACKQCGLKEKED